MTKAAYRSQPNGQSEQFKQTTVHTSRHYLRERQDEWDIYIQAPKYAYNAQVHKTRKTTPSSLGRSREPSGTARIVSPLFATKTDDNYPLAVRKNIMTGIYSQKREIRAEIEKAQARYKVDYDISSRRQPEFVVGDSV